MVAARACADLVIVLYTTMSCACLGSTFCGKNRVFVGSKSDQHSVFIISSAYSFSSRAVAVGSTTATRFNPVAISEFIGISSLFDTIQQDNKNDCIAIYSTQHKAVVIW